MPSALSLSALADGIRSMPATLTFPMNAYRFRKGSRKRESTKERLKGRRIQRETKEATVFLSRFRPSCFRDLLSVFALLPESRSVFAGEFGLFWLPLAFVALRAESSAFCGPSWHFG